MPEVTLRGGVGARIDAETEVKRSRFLTRLVRVEQEAEAREQIERARREHWDARHHCTAMVLGALGSGGRILRSNDDGEPSGTAGAPMLEVLIGRAMVDAVAIVTRYFGGVLLGTGGLARAYADAVQAAITAAEHDGMLVQRLLRERSSLALPHAEAGRVEAELRARGITVLGVDYAERATLRLAHAPDARDALASTVAMLTGGGAALDADGEEWVDVPLKSPSARR